MNLKNYTSGVPAGNSIANISRCLIHAGATNISHSYDPVSRQCDGMYFIPVNGIPIVFKLPVKVAQCEKYLLAQRIKLTPEAKTRCHEQAERTAWKILHEWIEIQVSMIQLQQAEATEIFLPYIFNPATNKTLFERYKETGFKQLTAGGGDHA